MYYKRKDSREWRGPGKVIGQDGQQVLIKHGSSYVHVHPCRVMLKDSNSGSYIKPFSDVNDVDDGDTIVEGNGVDQNVISSIRCEEESDSENDDSLEIGVVRNVVESVPTVEPCVSDQDINVHSSILKKNYSDKK